VGVLQALAGVLPDYCCLHARQNISHQFCALHGIAQLVLLGVLVAGAHDVCVLLSILLPVHLA